MGRQRVFLTGSHGFLGSRLKIKLQNHSEIELLVHDRATYPYENIEKLRKLLSSINIIIHIGGLVKGSDKDLFDANTASVVNLLEASQTNIHFIYASSFAVYKPQNVTITEKTSIQPRNFYGLSKKMAEEILIDKSNHGSIKSSILRFANIYGEGSSNSIVWTIYNKLLNNEEITINGDGTQSRDFLYVDDAVNAIMKSVNLKNTTGIFNVCTNKPYTLNQVISLLEAKSGLRAKISYNTNAVENGYWIGSYVKAKKILDWSPEVSFQEGIQKL
jgi:nucleoside-diphosphate-sugar epimerase